MVLRPVCIVLLLLAGCTVPGIEYEGKVCDTQCPDALVCIDARCRRVDAAVYVSGFQFQWATPNAIRWAWRLEGAADELADYALELRRGDGHVTTLTSADLKELGGPYLRRSGGYELVSGVITGELESSTTYTAVLHVNDVHGHSFTSTSARGVTDAPGVRHLLVFDDELTGGAFALPEAPVLSVTATEGLDGGAALTYRAALASPAEFENLRVSGMKLEAGDSLSARRFESAYLEFWVRGKGTPTSSWCEVWVRFAPTVEAPCANANECLWSLKATWVYRPDVQGTTWRRVQLPLSAFRWRAPGELPLTFADFSRAIYEVNVGLPVASVLDEAHLDGIGIYW